ncbi:MAG: hypothetical protein ABI703_10680 [Gemmatimonadales bacterium]
MTERCHPAASPRCRASFLSAISVLSVISVLSIPLTAQTIPARGAVLKGDSTPVAGTRVVLHQVGRALQGPLDSTRTDPRGRFRFSFRPDTSALYLVSVRHSGIEYFSSPLQADRAQPDTAIRVIVYDTSSTAPVSLEARHLVVTQPGEDGSRNVLDLLVLRNAGERTRVAPDSAGSSWSGLLPGGTTGLELGESDVSPEAVTRRGDSILVAAPLAPGEKQITVQYAIAGGRKNLELRFPDAVSSVNVLAEESHLVVSGGSLALADSQVLQGRSFRRWTGSVPAGGTLRIALPGLAGVPKWLLPSLVAAIVLALVAAAWYFLARLPGAPALSTAKLLDAIAALDARYLGREGETPAADWIFYQTERRRLKAELEAALAARAPSE